METGDVSASIIDTFHSLLGGDHICYREQFSNAQGIDVELQELTDKIISFERVKQGFALLLF